MNDYKCEWLKVFRELDKKIFTFNDAKWTKDYFAFINFRKSNQRIVCKQFKNTQNSVLTVIDELDVFPEYGMTYASIELISIYDKKIYSIDVLSDSIYSKLFRLHLKYIQILNNLSNKYFSSNS